jgi:hypothetical protein
MLLATRLRRADPRTGWLIAVGGAFLTTAVLFSAASGIFHPYYVSLLAPFAAALVGAGAAQLIGGGLHARVFAPLALAGGVTSELLVLRQYPGQLTWLAPVLIAVCALAGAALIALGKPRVRMAASGAAIVALLLAPSVWAVDTLGHATSGTFPEGGPASVATAGGAGTFGGFAGRPGGTRGVQLFGTSGGPSAGGAQSSGGGPQGPGAARVAPPSGSGFVPGSNQGAPSPSGPLPAGAGARGGRSAGIPGGAGGAGFGGRGAIGAPFGNDQTTTQALAYVKHHGGGTIAVSSQSSAASAIISSDSNVAGIGGFSGRESDVSVSWLAQKVRSGSIRWVLSEGSGARSGVGPGLPGDTRAGSKAAMSAVAKACQAVTLPTSTSSTSASAAAAGRTATAGGTSASTLYDCQGRAAELAAAGG